MVPTDDLKTILDRVHDWTRAADQKVSAAVVIESVTAALLAPAIPEWFTAPDFAGYRWLVALAIVLWGVSTVAAAATLFARTKNPHPRKSVTFFGNIAAWTVEEYRTKIDGLDDAEYRNDYIDQIHACADICRKKHDYLKLSVCTFLAALGLLVLCYCVRGWYS